MERQYLLIILSCGIAFVINLIAIPLVISITHRYKIYDRPNNRKIHKNLIPRLGGIGIFLSFTISVAITYSLFYFVLGYLPSLFKYRYITLLIGILIIFILGIIDDFKPLKALIKLIIQIVAAIIVTLGGFVIDVIPIPYIGTIFFGFFAYPITIIWIIGITNSINLVDGMDGLSSGIVSFAALSMGVIALIEGRPITAVIAFALLGSALGFLRYNFPPAKIFMGDSGAYFLGFTLSILPLLNISKAASFGSLLVLVTVLMFPIVDTFMAIVRRIKNHRAIGMPDKEHIHHKLMELRLGERKILAIIYCICLYLSIIAVTSVILPKESNVYLILVVWIGTLLGYWLLTLLQVRKKSIQSKKDK